MADFDLLALPLLWIPIQWAGLSQAEEAGVAVPITHEVEIQVKILDRDQFSAWLKKCLEDSQNPDVDAKVEREIFRTVACNWRKIKGSPEFSDDNIDKLLRWPGFIVAFADAYREAWHGRAKVREGNSASSPSAGRAEEAQGATETDASKAS